MERLGDRRWGLFLIATAAVATGVGYPAGRLLCGSIDPFTGGAGGLEFTIVLLPLINALAVSSGVRRFGAPRLVGGAVFVIALAGTVALEMLGALAAGCFLHF
jgi:hypothetical protein